MNKHKIIVGGEGGITHEHRRKQIEADEAEAIAEEEEEKKSLFTKNWTQNSVEYYKKMDWLAQKSSMALRVFNFLVLHMDNYNAVMCSYVVLMEYFSVERNTVRKALKILREHGYIAVLKSGVSNVYAVNHDLVWKSWRKNIQYSKFPVNVILSLSEQEEAVKLKITKQKQLELKEEKGQEKEEEKGKGTPQKNQSQSQLMAEV